MLARKKCPEGETCEAWTSVDCDRYLADMLVMSEPQEWEYGIGCTMDKARAIRECDPTWWRIAGQETADAEIEENRIGFCHECREWVRVEDEHDESWEEVDSLKNPLFREFLFKPQATDATIRERLENENRELRKELDRLKDIRQVV